MRVGKTPVIVAVTLIAVVGLNGAMAQLAPGRSGSSTMRYFSGEEVWQSLGSFGRCYASRNQKKAFELIATEPGSRDEAERYKALFRKENQSCLGFVTELRVPYTMVRGAIAEGLYKQGVAVPANLVLSAPGSDEPISNLAAAARCYTASQMEKARALIMTTRPGSKEESAELQKMMPEFGKCIPDGAQMNVSAPQVRFRLAEALYRMSPPSNTPAGGK